MSDGIIKNGRRSSPNTILDRNFLRTASSIIKSGTAKGYLEVNPMTQRNETGGQCCTESHEVARPNT